MARAAARHVGQPGETRIDGVDVASVDLGAQSPAGDAQGVGGLLTRAAALAVRTVDELVRRVRVDDEQREARVVEVERHLHRLVRQRVESQRVPRFAEHGRELIHRSGRCSRDLVLGEAPEPGDARPVEPPAGEVVPRRRRRTTQGRRRRQPGAARYVGRERDVEPRHVEAVATGGPSHAGGVGRPSEARLPRHLAETHLDTLAFRGQAHEIVVAPTCDGDRTRRQGDG